MASLMRALIIDGTKSASVQRVPVPVPGPGQVVVDVHRVGHLRHRCRAFHQGAALFRAGQVAFPAVPGPRVVRHRVRRPGRTSTSAGWARGSPATPCSAAAAAAGARPGGTTCARTAARSASPGGPVPWPRSCSCRPAASTGCPTWSTTGPARWWSRAGTRGARWRPRTRDRARQAARSGGRAASGCSRRPSRAPRARRWTWPASTRAATNWPGASARRATSPPRTRRGTLQRGHRLHRRRSGPRARPAVHRAGRPDRLHRPVAAAEPGRQPGDRAQRHHGGGHTRRVGRPGARHRALRGRPGRPRAARAGARRPGPRGGGPRRAA